MKNAGLTDETLKGVWAGVTLSWNEDYSLDEASFRENLKRLCTSKVHGIYTTGSTGEFYVLDFSEFRLIVDIVLEVVSPSRIPIQIGCCADDTRDVQQQIEYAARSGADGVQIVVPYWMELTDAELLQYFKDMATVAPDLPLIHYNIPRAKSFLTGLDYRRILEVAPNLIGVKFTFAGSHFGELQQSLQITPELSYFVGEDLLVSAMQLGARGSYSSMVCTNPTFMQELFTLAETRQWDKAISKQWHLAKFFRELGVLMERLNLGGIDPVADKGLAIASGFFAGHQRTRAPYIGWSDTGVNQVRAWLKEHYPEFLAPHF
jgi:dihydrodipicolinate synthase/N-acetylneuraminate lyase